MAVNAARGKALRQEIEKIESDSGAKAIAVAAHDTETSFDFRYKADRWFHAASTIKVPILLGVFDSIAHGKLLPHSRIHVSNRFLSAVEGAPFRDESECDSNSTVHAAIGKMLREIGRAHV